MPEDPSALRHRLVDRLLEEGVVRRARAHLRATGFGWVEVLCLDGALGSPEDGPFDGIGVQIASKGDPVYPGAAQKVFEKRDTYVIIEASAES